MLQVPAPSVQIIRAVLREYHAATHTAEVEPVLGPASLVGEIPVLISCRPDLLTNGRQVAVLAWSDVGGLVLGPYGAVPADPPSADDADKVDGIHAASTATANKLLALNASSKLPASITGDADTVDSIHAAASATANKLLALDASSKLPASITGDADTVDSIHAATTPTASKLLAMNANAKFPAHTVEGTLTVEGDVKPNRVHTFLWEGVVAADTWVDVPGFTVNHNEMHEVYANFIRTSGAYSVFAKATVGRGSTGTNAVMSPVTQWGHLSAVNLRVINNTVQIYRSSNVGGGAREMRITGVRVN
jgi:hypothetical protein